MTDMTRGQWARRAAGLRDMTAPPSDSNSPAMTEARLFTRSTRTPN